MSENHRNEPDFTTDVRRRDFPLRRGHGRPLGRRGMITPNVLKALEEKPMHGYEIIQHFEQKSFGFWKPSPGSIYPILQELDDQGMVSSHEEGDKRIYELTKAGRASLKNLKFPWGYGSGGFGQRIRRGELIRQLMGSGTRRVVDDLRTIGRHGSVEDVKAAGDLMNQTAKKLNDIVTEMYNHE